MTRNTIKEIIRTYLENEVPRQVRESFGKWMVSGTYGKEKEEALESLWEKGALEGHVFSKALPDALSVIHDAENLSGKRVSFLRTGLWASSAAALVFAVLSIALIFSRKGTEICIASSDMAKAYFILPDSTEIWLNKGSRLYFSESSFGKKERKVKLEGEGFFDVAENRSLPFTVLASDISITAIGTEFTVSSYSPDGADTYLQEGSVKISGPDLKKNIILKPDQALFYKRDGAEYSLKRVRASNHTSWIKERLVFENASLYDITESLRHWYGAEIPIRDTLSYMNTRLSLTIRQEPLCEILEAIERIVPESSAKE